MSHRMVNDINKELEKLYCGQLIDSGLAKYLHNRNIKLGDKSDQHYTYPYLLSVPDNYSFESNPFVVMIFGRETYGWGRELNNDQTDYFRAEVKITKIMEHYNKTLIKNIEITKGFWTYVRLLKEKIDETFGSKVILLYNNVAKIGYQYGRTGFDPDINMKFRVIPEEISIIKPDLLLFITGDTRAKQYDKHITTLIAQFSISKTFSGCQFAKLKFKNMNTEAYRAFYPIAKKRTDKDWLTNKIIKIIKDRIYPCNGIL